MTDLNFENNRLLDIVNDEDIIIGAKPRIDVHRLALLHREIHVFMFDENKNIFFQKKGLHKSHAGLLDATVAGHLNQGENYVEAAIRETEEETGINLSMKDLILIKKMKESILTPDPLGKPVNNFIRYIYIYTKPIKESMLRKEDGIQGGGFQKFSFDFLNNLTPEHEVVFHHSIPKELPEVLEYVRKWKK